MAKVAWARSVDAPGWQSASEWVRDAPRVNTESGTPTGARLRHLEGLGQPRLGAARRHGRSLLIGAATGLVTRPLTVEGAVALPTGRPLLLVANHASHLDAPVVLAALPRAIRDRTLVAAARDYFYRDPGRAALAALLGSFPFARSGGVTAQRASLDEAAALLATGWSVLLFPEGSRSRDGALGRFRAGVVHLARRTGAPVIPIGLTGTNEAWPVGGRPWGGPVLVRFGRPWIPRHGSTDEMARALATEVARLIGSHDLDARCERVA